MQLRGCYKQKYIARQQYKQQMINVNNVAFNGCIRMLLLLLICLMCRTLSFAIFSYYEYYICCFYLSFPNILNIFAQVKTLFI